MSYWLKRLFTCNPFYLVSAGLLLYGFYRISVDPGFLGGEAPQLLFNYSSLQFYEVLLVATSVFLARRAIWHDSMLLIGLENLLVLVPFILTSQAGLIDLRMVWAMCVIGAGIAVARAGGVKKLIPALNFPSRSAFIGLLVIAVNAALPVLYRILHEHKFGTKPDWGAAYETNQWAWWLLLPALSGLAAVVPTGRAAGSFPPRRWWLPLGLFALWLGGTVVHLYCLGYVYDFTLRPDHAAPIVWMLSWISYWRLGVWLPRHSPKLKRALLVSAVLATLLATLQPGLQVFLILTILNAAIFATIAVGGRDRRLALHLMSISLVALLGGLPEEWGRSFIADFTRARCVGASAALYLLLCSALSRNPKLGLLGSLTAAACVVGVAPDQPNTSNWAIEAALVFIMLHSLRWVDADEPGARHLRVLASALWATHAVAWVCMGAAGWMTCVTAAPVIAGYLAARLFRGRWGPVVVPISALVVMLSGPGSFGAGRLQSVPAGIFAVAGSFILFGLGTLVALTRHRWSK